MAVAQALAFPLGDLDRLRRRVAALAEHRPAVYRMVDPTGRVIYVGKAQRLRARLLSYFGAQYPGEKQARILRAAADIQWDYKPSDFAALLAELRLIRQYRPLFNVRMNRDPRLVFVKVFGGAAPKLSVGGTPSRGDVRHYGPFTGMRRLEDGVRVLNDLLGLRDCALDAAIAYAEQGDLFDTGRRAGCLRYDIGTCTGPCAGFVTEEEYQRRVRTAVAFLEGSTVAPIDRVVDEMNAASERKHYERAALWRDRFDALTWLLAAVSATHAAIEAMSFVYTDPGVDGDDRAYVIRRATVRAAAPAPHTPIEREAFTALVAEHAGEETQPGPIPAEHIHETLLILRWFRKHPGALRRTVPLDQWLDRTRQSQRC
jgi:excinuclease ABC subunit C